MGPLTRTLEIPGIAAEYGLERLRYFAQREMRATQQPTPQELLHLQVSDSGHSFHIVCYASHKVVFQGSRAADSKVFGKTLAKMCNLVREAAKRLLDESSQSRLRSKALLDYVESFDFSLDTPRMAGVVLCDTLSEILVADALRVVGVKDENIPDSLRGRVERLERSRRVFLRDEILKVRYLRNKVAHAGELPHRSEAQFCLDIARKFYDFF